MALEQPHRTLGKVTTVFATKLKSFTFVPFLKRLPAENRVWKKVFQTNRAKSSGEPGDREKSMAEERIYKAEVIYVQDPEDGQLGETHKNTTQSEIQSTDNITLKPPTTLVGPPTESSAVYPEPAVIETTANKHPGISHLGFHNISEAAEVSSGLSLNSSSQRQEALSPAGSVDFFNSPTSSKESILSEGWDKERSWSGLHMFSRDGSPGLSRTVSPCSSIRSGTFTPSVVRIKRHSLAPGSSLLHMSSTCGTPCCDSRATSPCPLSPRGRHRLPPTQLTLLTAILRKGRLPVLSSSSQRPYTPCWPISPVNVSSCLACSAASSVAPMNLPKAKSCTGIDRSCSESCQSLQKQDQRSLLRVETTDENILTKPPERFDSCQPFSSSRGTESQTNHTPSPSLPPLQTAHSHLSKLSHRGNRLPVVPSSLLCGSHMSRSSPKASSRFYSSTDTQKNQLGSGDCPATVDTNKSAESLASARHVETKNRSDNYSIELNSQKSSSEPYSKHKESSVDSLAQNSCKPPSFYHPFESHSDSENQRNQLVSREGPAIRDTNKSADILASSMDIETIPYDLLDVKYSAELKPSQNSSNEPCLKLREISAVSLQPYSAPNSCKSPSFYHTFESHSDSENQRIQLVPSGCPAIVDASKLPESLVSLTQVESKPRSDGFSAELKQSQKPTNEPYSKLKESSADYLAQNSALNPCKSPSFYHSFESHNDSENQKNELSSRERPAMVNTSKLPESLASVAHVETKPRPEEYSAGLKQSQKASDSKHNESSDNLVWNSCKSPSFYHSLDSHRDSENQKNVLASRELPAIVDTSKLRESLVSLTHVESRPRSDGYSAELKHSQKPTNEPYSKIKHSSADYLAPNSALNPCKSPSFYHTFESHGDSENQRNPLVLSGCPAIVDASKLPESLASLTHVESKPRSDEYSAELKQSRKPTNEPYSKLKESSADYVAPNSALNPCKSPSFYHLLESHSDSENQKDPLASRERPAIMDTSKLPELLASVTHVETKRRPGEYSAELKHSQKPTKEPYSKLKESSADYLAPNSALNPCKSPSFYQLFESHRDSENQKNELSSRERPAIVDTSKLPESLASVTHIETKPRPGEHSAELKQSQKPSYSKHNEGSDNPEPNPARNSCKSPSTFESHINSDLTIKGNKIRNNLERVLLSSPALRLSPSPKPMGLSYTPPVSPAFPSVQPKSRSSTPDRGTLSPSPGRQLSPSPSYSCSSPSPSLWGSSQDCADGDCKNRKTYKIKSTYKALAAIPTNTLLLEQQAIDEEVSKKEALLNPADNYSWEDPHAEMCSPAQLRQQTAELYATIDEVLEDTIQTRQSNHVNKAMVKSLAAEASRQQTSSPSPKLLGRETRYASSPFQPSVTAEKTMTKPGVIRPVIITSRFTEDQDEEFHPNPFKIHQGSKSNRYQYKFVSGGLCAGTPADAPADSHPQPSETQEDYKSRLASTQEVPSAVNTLETHI